MIAGPHLGKLVDREAVSHLSHVNTLALALIALAGGAELRGSELARALRSLITATLVQNVAGMLALTASFVVAARFIPFAHGLGFAALCGVGLLWAVLGTSRSPSATLAILSQTRATGALASFSLAFIMLSDVVVILLLAVVLLFARPLIDGTPLSFDELGALGHEVIGSASLGITLGLLLAAYLRLVGGQLLLVLIAIGFGLTEGLSYLRFDPLLTFLIAGFVVQNMSSQGDKLLHSIERTGSVVYVVFFATAGTDLDVPLLRALWPVALGLAAARGVVTWGAHRLGSSVRRRSDRGPALGLDQHDRPGRTLARARGDGRAHVPLVRRRLPLAGDRDLGLEPARRPGAVQDRRRSRAAARARAGLSGCATRRGRAPPCFR